MYTTDRIPNEDDLRLRAHILFLAAKFGFSATDCSIDTYLGVLPIDRFTLRFPGGSASGSYRQVVAALSGANTRESFVADCWSAQILD